MAEQATYTAGLSNVPLYDTLGSESLAFIVGQTSLAVIFCSIAETPKLVAAKAGGAVPSLVHVVQFEAPTPEGVAAAAAAGLQLHSFTQLVAEGKAAPLAPRPPAPTDIAYICYTSGTTGMPKGAVIQHGNMVADASAAQLVGLNISVVDSHLSYLPLAHVFERIVHAAVLAEGAAIGFYQGDTLKLMDDLKELRPTIFVSVPRLWNKIYDKVTGGAAEAGGIKAALFHAAVEGKKYWLTHGGHQSHVLWDSLVFNGVKARLGMDRTRLLVTGSAPLAPHVQEFLRVLIGAPMLEGYGQTECSAACSATPMWDQGNVGHVGIPLPCCEIKLVSVPEMGYKVGDTFHDRTVDAAGAVLNPGLPCNGRGEVCVRGANVFPGYYKEPAHTAEVLDADGWLHSGDIGLWDARGMLRIIDRKKNIFKLSQGEYVAAEKLEGVYTKSHLVAQAFVYGDSLHAVLVAVVVPSEDGARLWAKSNGMEGATIEALAVDVKFITAVREDMVREAKAAKLQR